MSEVSTTPTSDPTSLITDEGVTSALQKDKGKDAVLVSWYAKDFTKKGDNYASHVTRIYVTYKNKATNEQQENTTYVVKLNPLRDSEAWNSVTNELFDREATVFNVIVPILNETLVNLNLPPLRIPACYYENLALGKEILINEDLATRGFKMIERQKGLDTTHLNLVVQELARMQAAFQVHETQSNKDAKDIFPILTKELFVADSPIIKVFDAMVKGQLNTCIKLLKALKTHEDVIEMLERLAKASTDIYLEHMSVPESPKFCAISHGDCWSNNFLFRYNEDHKPVEVMLLDLQIAHLSSVGLDLNHVLYSTLEPSQNKSKLNTTLKNYHQTYQEIMEQAHIPPRFTLDELHQEFKAKNPYGYVMGLVMVPIVALDEEDLVDMGGFNDENDAAEAMANQEKRVIDIALSGGLFKQRFLALIEDIQYSGCI